VRGIFFSTEKSGWRFFRQNISIFGKQQQKRQTYTEISGKDRQAHTHVFSSENKISVSKNLNLTESSTSIDADMEKILLSFLVVSFYPLAQKNGV